MRKIFIITAALTLILLPVTKAGAQIDTRAGVYPQADTRATVDPQTDNRSEADIKTEAGVRQAVDTTVVPTIVDTTLVGRNILELMPSRSRGDSATVVVTNSYSVREAMQKHSESSSLGMTPGYRIRIFFSNAKNARTGSDEAVAKFRLKWSMPIYCTYTNPYFKVTVGNFRTRNEAMEQLQKIRIDFPGAFIVKEDVYYTY